MIFITFSVDPVSNCNHTNICKAQKNTHNIFSKSEKNDKVVKTDT